MNYINIIYILLSDFYNYEGDPESSQGDVFYISLFTIGFLLGILALILDFYQFLKDDKHYSIFKMSKTTYLDFIIVSIKRIINAPNFIYFYLKLKLIHAIWFFIIYCEIYFLAKYSSLNSLGITSIASISFFLLLFLIFFCIATRRYFKQNINLSA